MPHAYVDDQRLDENSLRAYADVYWNKLNSINVTGLLRYAILVHYHATYLNPSHYDHVPDPRLAHMTVESNRPMHRGEALVDEVLTFMMTTEVTALTGVTFYDIMNMDLDLFRQLKKKYEAVEAPKRAALGKLQAEMQKNANDWSSNHAKDLTRRAQSEYAKINSSK